MDGFNAADFCGSLVLRTGLTGFLLLLLRTRSVHHVRHVSSHARAGVDTDDTRHHSGPNFHDCDDAYRCR